METKRCSECREFKTLSEFYALRKSEDGRQGYCKVCANKKIKAYRIANSEKLLEHRRRYYYDNQEKELERARKYRSTRVEKLREKRRQYVLANPEKIREQSRMQLEKPGSKEKRHAYRIARQEVTYGYHISRKYKLSVDDYKNMVSMQRGKCAICGGDNDGKKLHVDHDHVTGIVRELLCNKCNHGLGNFVDDIELLKKAELYLIKHRSAPADAPVAPVATAPAPVETESIPF